VIPAATRLPVVPEREARGLFWFVVAFSLVASYAVRDPWITGAEWIAVIGLTGRPWNPYEEEVR